MTPGAMLAMLLTVPYGLELDPDAPCVTREALLRRLDAVGAAELAGLSQVRIHSRPGALAVEVLRKDGRRFFREVPAALDECPAVERVVAVLVASWAREQRLQASPAAGIDAGTSPAPDPVSPRGAGAAGAATPAVPDAVPEGHPSLSSRRPVEEGFTRARPAAARLHEPAPRASPPLGPEPPAAAATAGIQHGDEPSPPPSLGPVDVSTERRPGLAPQGSLVTPPALDRPVASAFPVGFRVVARGGAAGGTPPAPLPAAELALALTFGPFGIAANGGVSATLDTALPPGRVSTTAGWASLGGTGVLALSPKVDLDAALGGRLFIVQASTHGFTANRSVTLGSFALFAEAGLSVRVWGPVLLGLWLNAAWRPLEERLSVTGIEGSVNLPRWHLGGYAGAGLRWR